MILNTKNPAYGRHQLSRPMRIVGPIQFWRLCMIYRSAPKSGLGTRENADSVHAKVGTRSRQKCWLRSLRNTSPFLGLYSRSRTNSGTHPRFQGSTRDWDWDWDWDWTPEHTLVLGLYSRSRLRSNSGTHPCFWGSTQNRDQDRDCILEHILVFRALLEIAIEIEINLRNTSSFLGLYLRSRSRSNSGTQPRF